MDQGQLPIIEKIAGLGPDPQGEGLVLVSGQLRPKEQGTMSFRLTEPAAEQMFYFLRAYFEPTS
jgi:hypothetical protein